MEAPSAAPTIHRPDLDGLRGIAILLVVVYHAAPHVLPGGFLGVDLFFVLSGLLITHQLKESFRDGTFHLAHFYIRRVRRLFPALIVVLPAVLALGWVLLLEHEYRSLGHHTVAGTAFHANLALWREVGYFDASSWHKPLRHLWSLAVEEQFYLLWPVMLWILHRLRSPLRWTIPALFALSLFAAVTHPDGSGLSSFYLTHLRAWELLAGAWLARWPLDRPLLVRERLRSPAQAIGFLTVVVAAFGTPPEHGSALLMTMLPVFGTVLLIAGGGGVLSTTILAARPLVWLGLISYPLYLWHWPLLSLARVLYWDVPPTALIVVLVAVSVVLAWATFRWVEQPVRGSGWWSVRPGRALVLIAPMLLLLVWGASVEQRRPMERLHSISAVRSVAEGDKALLPTPELRGTTAETVLFLGDSYVAQLHPRLAYLRETLPTMRSARFHVRVGCPPLPGLASHVDTACAGWAEEGLLLAMDPAVHVVVIGCSWVGMTQRTDLYMENDPLRAPLSLGDPSDLDTTLKRLQARIDRLVAAGKQVHILLNPPGGDWAHPANATAARLRGVEVSPANSCSLAEHRARTGFINDHLRRMADSAGASVIDPEPWVCHSGRCWAADSQGVPVYSDATHFRAAYVRDRVTALDVLMAE